MRKQQKSHIHNILCGLDVIQSNKAIHYSVQVIKIGVIRMLYRRLPLPIEISFPSDSSTINTALK